MSVLGAWISSYLGELQLLQLQGTWGNLGLLYSNPSAEHKGLEPDSQLCQSTTTPQHAYHQEMTKPISFMNLYENKVCQYEHFHLLSSDFIAKTIQKIVHGELCFYQQGPLKQLQATAGSCRMSQVFCVSCCITRAQRLINCKYSSAPSARHLSTSCRWREVKTL